MNKKMISQLAAALILTGVVACSGSSETAKVEPAKPVVDVEACVYPGSDVQAPRWVCGLPVDGYELSAVGSFRSTKAGISTARNQATAQGRAALAAQMKVKVGQMVKSYLGTTGVADDETVDAATEDSVRQITAEKLIGSKAINFRTGPDGSTYALVVIDAQAVNKAAKESLATSLENKKALYQKFLMQKSQEELQAEMDKMFDAELQ